MKLPAILRWSIAALVLPVALYRRRAGDADETQGRKSMPYSGFMPGQGTAADTDQPVSNYELEAERLQRDISDASVRNKAALDAGQKQRHEVLSFEERSRETLRALMMDMGKGDDDSSS